VDDLTDTERCRALMEDQALAHGSLDTSEIQRVRAEMERAEARRLQPHFIQSFFLAAFANLGGAIKERESRRFRLRMFLLLSGTGTNKSEVVNQFWRPMNGSPLSAH